MHNSAKKKKNPLTGNSAGRYDMTTWQIITHYTLVKKNNSWRSTPTPTPQECEIRVGTDSLKLQLNHIAWSTTLQQRLAIWFNVDFLSGYSSLTSLSNSVFTCRTDAYVSLFKINTYLIHFLLGDGYSIWSFSHTSPCSICYYRNNILLEH